MNPKDILIAFSEQRASQDAVIRALVSFDEWFVPAVLGVEVTGETTFQKMLLLSSECRIPDGEIWIFSDEAAARLAGDSGRAPGPFVGPIPGVKLFRALPKNFLKLHINVGSPREETWYFEQEAFDRTALWSQAITTERLLHTPASPEKYAGLSGYRGYLYLVHQSNGALVTLPGVAGYKNPAVVFTAKDCLDALLAKVQAPPVEQKWAGGGALFEWLPSQGIDGILVNPCGPGENAALMMEIGERIAKASPPAQ